MSKFFKTMAKISGIASAVLAFVPGGQLLSAAFAANSAIMGALAQVTAKPPKAVGQVTNITVGANQPIPYMIGRSYSGGTLIHDTGYGGVVSKVDNPYRAITVVYSGAGPIQALVATQTDFSTVSFSGTAATGYYAGFLWRDWLDGAGPAPRALVANFAGEPGWSTAHKLSGFFAAKFTLKFDAKGKVWQAGVPQFGIIADGVRAYDPRLDSTFPGGSGSQRINNEATWAFTKNPALHALTYSYGRYQNGKKVFGVDLGSSGIDLTTAATWANICDANGWEANGSIFEPGDKWNNLKLICEAGGGVPIPGARLRFDYNAPGVAIDTITIHDLADGEISLPVTQGYATRINTVQGVYTSPDHRWEPVPTDKIVDTAALALDGEVKAEQFPFQLVTAKNQCAQLATYKMANSRELGPIVIPVKARLLTYPVGTFLTAQLPAVGLASQKVKIIGKRRTMEDGSGELTVVTETDAKHAFALAATSGAPPASVLVPPDRLDELSISLAPAPSSQAPEPPPADPVTGHIYIDATGHKFRFDGRQLLFGGDPLLFNGEPIYTSGYSDAQDQATVQALADAAAAQAAADAANAALALIDDDDVITVSEKVEVLIPGAAAFEALYTAVLANATAASVSVTTLNTKRTAWLAALAALSPAWNNTSAPSPVVRGSLDTARNEYDIELKTVQRLSIEAMTSAKAPDLTGNFSWGISGDVTGAVTTSLPVDRRYSALEGTADVSPTTDFQLLSISSGLSLTVNNTVSSADRGVVTMGTGTTNGGTATLKATLPGGGIVERVITVTKTNAIPATGGGAGATFAQDTSFTNITGTSHAAISDELVCRSDGSGNIRLSIDLNYSAAGGTSTRTPSFKASYATTPGGSLTDLFSEASGSSCIGGTEPEDGYYTRSEATFAMPAPNTDYYFKLQGRRSSGTGNISFNGTSFTVRQ